MHGPVPLERDGHRHEDGPRHARLVHRVQEPREHDDVQLRGQVEALPHALQDGPEKVVRVEGGERNEKEVEGVSKLAPGEDEAADDVPQESDGAERGLDDALQPEGDALEKGLLGGC